MRFRQVLFFFLFLQLTAKVYPAKVYQDLFINRGSLTTVKGTSFPFLAFNATPAFAAQNAIVSCLKNDTLILTVTNNDSIVHGFSVKGYAGISFTLNPGAASSCSLSATQRSIYTYYDHLHYPRNRYMGLAGMIAVKDKAGDKAYYWDLKEHETAFSQSLGYGVNWNAYYPDYFTINGKSFGDVQNDPAVKISSQVGDTVYIYVQNSGQAMHSLHFHGFHPVAVFTNCRLIKNGWSKDTYGMFPMDAMVLRMIPDKTGQYSVHDHNLVAVTGGNTHPNGMFTIMQIDP